MAGVAGGVASRQPSGVAHVRFLTAALRWGEDGRSCRLAESQQVSLIQDPGGPDRHHMMDPV